jgi:hypothetical protein
MPEPAKVSDRCSDMANRSMPGALCNGNRKRTVARRRCGSNQAARSPLGLPGTCPSPRAGPRSNSKPAERKTARDASKQTAPPQPTDNLRKYIRFEPLAPRAGPGRALHIGSARAGRARRRAVAAMEESKPPSINDCLAQLRQCLDPAAAAAIEQLNAAINARVDRLTQAVEGPSPWLEVGRALVRQVPTTRPSSKPKPRPKPVPKRRVVVEKPAPPPPAPAPAPVCAQPPIIDAELTAAASKLQASERGRAARKRRRKAPPPQKPKQKYATGRKIENKQPSKHDEHQLDMPVERVRAVVVRLHEAFPKVKSGVLGRGDGVEGWRG